MADKTRNELLEELAQLEKRLREIRAERKISMQDYKDQIHDVEDQIDQVLAELKDVTS